MRVESRFLAKRPTKVYKPLRIFQGMPIAGSRVLVTSGGRPITELIFENRSSITPEEVW